jgi:hypothetical protein
MQILWFAPDWRNCPKYSIFRAILLALLLPSRHARENAPWIDSTVYHYIPMKKSNGVRGSEITAVAILGKRATKSWKRRFHQRSVSYYYCVRELSLYKEYYALQQVEWKKSIMLFPPYINLFELFTPFAFNFVIKLYKLHANSSTCINWSNLGLGRHTRLYAGNRRHGDTTLTLNNAHYSPMCWC